MRCKERRAAQVYSKENEHMLLNVEKWVHEIAGERQDFREGLVSKGLCDWDDTLMVNVVLIYIVHSIIVFIFEDIKVNEPAFIITIAKQV